MSRGLEDLLSVLVARRERHQQIADSYPPTEYCSDWRWHMGQISDLDSQIERVLNLLERD